MTAIPNDPLAGLPFMRLFRQCVYAARIGVYAKAVLIRIAEDVEADGRGCSISFSKLAYDLEIDETTVKRIVKKFRDTWLHVQRCQGRLIPGVGRENLYGVMSPPSVVDELRAHRLANLQAEITGVVSRHPARSNRGGSQPHVLVTDIHLELDTKSKSHARTRATGADATQAAGNIIAFDPGRLRWRTEGGSQ